MLMFLNKNGFSLGIIISFLHCITAQNVISTGDSLNRFSVNLLRVTTEEAGDELNIALSPYTVWSLLSIILEGARENTAAELKQVLYLDGYNKDTFRKDYRNLTNLLMQSSDGVQLLTSNAIFTNSNQKLKTAFQSTAKNSYNVDVIPVEFKNTLQSARLINSYVSKATNNRINNFIQPGDVLDAEVFLTATFFFKGNWKYPFNKSETKNVDFFDSKGRVIGKVNIMRQLGVFAYSKIKEIKSHAVELPYGNDNTMSMLLILPFKGEHILNVLNLLMQKPIGDILRILEDAEQQFMDENVEVQLPKFQTDSDLILNRVLQKMGIREVFDAYKADLLGMFYHYLYVSRFVQKAEIEVNEEGTVASAASGAIIDYKSPPPRFLANRPFLYFIVNKKLRTVMFCGKISNPSTL